MKPEYKHKLVSMDSPIERLEKEHVRIIKTIEALEKRKLEVEEQIKIIRGA